MAPSLSKKSVATPKAIHAVALGSPVLNQVIIGVQNYGGDFVTVSYQCLPANRPSTYGNTVYIWEATAIPWGQPAYYQRQIDTNQQNGVAILTGLTIASTTYIIGYAPAPDPAMCCASVLLDAGGMMAAPTSVNIGVRSIGNTSVAIRYSVLSGYLPADNGNWVGIWQSYTSPYNCPEPIGYSRVPNLTEGTVNISDVPITIDTAYTVVYFMGQPENRTKNTTAAAILTFDTASIGSPKSLVPSALRTFN